MNKPELIAAYKMICRGWAPIEYASPYEIDGEQFYIRWNGIKEGWEVLNHPTIDDNKPYATPELALAEILRHDAKADDVTATVESH